jgi:hypothetical protein
MICPILPSARMLTSFVRTVFAYDLLQAAKGNYYDVFGWDCDIVLARAIVRKKQILRSISSAYDTIFLRTSPHDLNENKSA